MLWRHPVPLFPVSALFLVLRCAGQIVPPAELAAAAAPAAAESSTQQTGLQSRPSASVGPDYRVGPGDVLRVAVFDEPQFSTSTVVRPDGKISIPLVADLLVSGMTPEATQVLLTTQLSKYIKHPRVTVIVEEIHSRIVYVTGEVQHPGAYPLLTPTNVVQLIARAGGPTEFAKRKDVYVLHQDGGARTKVNYQLILSGKHLEENVALVPGDTVVVP